MIRFASPYFLLLLIIIPILYFWSKYWGKKNEGTLKISSATLFKTHFGEAGKKKIFLLDIIQNLLLVFIVIGLARPQLVESLEETTMEVVDIVLVLDISSSMLAEDFSPNRLEAAKKTAEKFIENRHGDRLGLLVFAGETFIQCPLTVDMTVLKNLLREVTVAEREYDGTAIGIAIANAVNRLRAGETTSKVMILLSDGSNNAGELDPLTSADLAAEFDIRIYTIGAGTNQSVTFIPNRGYIRNEIDEETLKAIAKRTNGKYFRATDEKRLAEVYEEINQLERSEIEVKQITLHADLFAFFLIPGLILGLVYHILAYFVFRKSI